MGTGTTKLPEGWAKLSRAHQVILNLVNAESRRKPAEAPVIPNVSRFHYVEVRHDPDCSVWSRKPCDCAPVMEAGERIDGKYGHDS